MMVALNQIELFQVKKQTSFQPHQTNLLMSPVDGGGVILGETTPIRIDRTSLWDEGDHSEEL